MLKPAPWAWGGQKREESKVAHPLGLLKRDDDGLINTMTVKASPGSSGKYELLESYMDSGAARSVCPKDFGGQFGLHATQGSKGGEGFKTATGKRVANQGGRVITGTTEAGRTISMNYAVADITMALDSISQICDSGARVVFEKDGGYIVGKDGVRSGFVRKGDTYVHQIWVERDVAPTPFSRPRP